MNNEKKKAPLYIEVIAWIAIHAPHYALFYITIELIRWYISTK